ncbi:NUDIX hydrolase [Halobacteriales archaeon QS_3_64_16]|nr:MAG: NUDIX hydrolase [Halobacteriales archaeon QS_3_64_16]
MSGPSSFPSLPSSLAPEDLASRYDGVCRRANTIAFESERWTTLEAEAEEWGVGAFCYHDDAVLLVCEGEEWLLPGGILEAGETPEEGARRELREETGVDADIEGLAAITTQTFVDEAEPANRFDFRFATFLATTADPTTSSEPGLDGEGIETVAWVSEIPENTFDRKLVVDLFQSVVE